MVELWLASKMKQQTLNKTNFRFGPSGEGDLDPFASSQKELMKTLAKRRGARVRLMQAHTLLRFTRTDRNSIGQRGLAEGQTDPAIK